MVPTSPEDRLRAIEEAEAMAHDLLRKVREVNDEELENYALQALMGERIGSLYEECEGLVDALDAVRWKITEE